MVTACCYSLGRRGRARVRSLLRSRSKDASVESCSWATERARGSAGATESGAEGEARAKSHVVVLEYPEKRSSEFTVRASPSRSVAFQHRIDNIVSSRRDDENYCRKCCSEKAHRRCSPPLPLRSAFSLRCPADGALARSLAGSASADRIDFGTIQPALCIYSGARLAHDQRLCLLICMFSVRCLVASLPVFIVFPKRKFAIFCSLRKCYYFRLLNYTLEMRAVAKIVNC